MKIALLRHMMDQPQGGARLIALLARDLRELGEDVTIYCYGYDQANCFPHILTDVPVRCVRRLASVESGEMGVEAGVRRSLAQVRRYYHEAPALASLIDADTEILNPHEWLAHRAAALVGRHRRIPIVWTYNDPSHWHEHHAFGLREIPYRLFGWLDTRQVNRFAAVATLSQWMAAVANRAFAARVHLVRCGIDARGIPAPVPVPIRSAAPRALRLLSVGILAPWRRLEDAIEGVAIARREGCECRLEIIGSDRFAPAYGLFLRKLVSERGLEGAVDLRLRSVSELELEKAFARADVAVFPNEQQAWGLAQLEAMARGVAVIVSRGAGVSEVLTDGVDSLLVQPRQPLQIARAIARLTSAPLRGRVAESGRRLVLDSYTSVHYARTMQSLFRSCFGTARAERVLNGAP